MENKVYEKKICWLEQCLEQQRRINGGLRLEIQESEDNAVLKADKQLAGLIAFMTNLYAELGKIQGQLLQHLSTLNEQSVKNKQTGFQRVAQQIELLTGQSGREE